MSFLSLYRDPIVAETTSARDWRIADLIDAERPVSLYLVVPPSDISRTRPLVRLILNQIARRLTEKLQTLGRPRPARRQLLLMLDEFPALGRLDFFETALTFLAGYGVRAYPDRPVAQPDREGLRGQQRHPRQLPRAHRLRRQRRAHGQAAVGCARHHDGAPGAAQSGGPSALAVAVASGVSEQETPRALLTPGEVMQLPTDEALMLVSGTPPIRAKKLRYFEDRNFTPRCLPAPRARARRSVAPFIRRLGHASARHR